MDLIDIDELKEINTDYLKENELIENEAVNISWEHNSNITKAIKQNEMEERISENNNLNFVSTYL